MGKKRTEIHREPDHGLGLLALTPAEIEFFSL